MPLIHKKFLAFRFIFIRRRENYLFNSYEDTAWPPQCHNFDSTAGAGGFTAGAAAPAVNMLEEALAQTTVGLIPTAVSPTGHGKFTITTAKIN